MGALTEGTHEVETGSFTLEGTGGAPVTVLHARPRGATPVGIVVHPDIGGLRPLFEDLVRRLASHGYAVGAFEPFARIDSTERAEMDLEARMAAMTTLRDSEQLGDLTRTADALAERDDVRAVAVIGFCMGGMYTLKAAATGRFDRAGAFYGQLRVPEGWRSPQLAEPLATASEVCPTIAILGGQDRWTPDGDIEALRAEWAHRPDCEVVVYPDADHGFVHDPERSTHRAADAADAWHRVLGFFEPLSGAA